MKRHGLPGSLLIGVCVLAASAACCGTDPASEEDVSAHVVDQTPPPLIVYQVMRRTIESGLLGLLRHVVPDSLDSIPFRGDLAVIGLAEGWIPSPEAEQLLVLYALINTACSDSSVAFATFNAPKEDGWLVPLEAAYEPGFAYLLDDWWRTGFEVLRGACSLASLEVPTYFRPVGWSASGELIGISGDHLEHYGIEVGRFTSWEIAAWDATVSPGGTHVAFQDGSGLHRLRSHRKAALPSGHRRRSGDAGYRVVVTRRDATSLFGATGMGLPLPSLFARREIRATLNIEVEGYFATDRGGGFSRYA